MPPLDIKSLEAMSLLDCSEDGTFCFAGQQQRQVLQPPSNSSTAMDAKLEALDSKLDAVRQEGQNLRRPVDGMQEFMERYFDEMRRVRLDWAMANLDWNSLFPESKNFHDDCANIVSENWGPMGYNSLMEKLATTGTRLTDWNKNNFENFHRHIRKLQEGIEKVYMTAVGQPDMTRL
ncbi:uncharacterized protein G2W53_041936 [Senna tora]|uniref:Uncharacterized protein n=1 Tax=Senna tora TaxID=362788 RepID=A0A834SEJ1_9FABA|nr:uncharacterized protein G2W53_041936 [Senna tora]